MGLYLYAFVPVGVAPPRRLRGIERERVFAIDGEVGCWLSRLPAAPEPTLERIRRHNEVVEVALARGVTPLPVRFGQWLEGEAELDRWLEPRTARIAEALGQVRGAVEYGLRLLDPGANGPGAFREEAWGLVQAIDAGEAVRPAPAGAGAPSGSGTEFMRVLAQRASAKRRAHAHGQEIAARLRSVSGLSIRQERIEALPSRHGLVSVTHLVERMREAEYRASVENVRRDYPWLRFLLSGPWPPWSFVP